MPIVPVDESVTVAPTGLPDARLQTPMQMLRQGTLGADHMMQEGAQMEHAGGQFAAMITSQQIHENEVNVKQHDANLMTGANAILNGDPNDPNSKGYLGQQGMDAADPRNKKSALDAIDQMAKASADNTLTNPAQLQMAGTLTQIRVAGAKEQIEKHATQQGLVANTAAEQLRGKVAAENAAGAFDGMNDSATLDPSYNPASVSEGKRSPYQDSLYTLQASLNSLVDLHIGENAPADVRAAMVKEGMASAYAGTLSHLLQGVTKGDVGTGANELTSADLAIAKDYFEKVKPLLNPQQADHFQAVINAGAAKTVSLDTARQLQQTFPGDYAAQVGKLGELYDAKEVDANTYHAALTNLNAGYEVEQRVTSQQTAQLMGDLGAKAQKPGSTLTSTASAEQLAFITEHGLWPHAEALFNRSSTKDNPVLYMQLLSEATQDPATFMARGPGGIAALKGYMSDSNFNHIEQLYGAIDKKSVEQMSSASGAMKAINEITRQLDQSGINTHAKPGTNAEAQLAQFQSDVVQRIQLAQKQNNGTMLTDEQMRDIALGEAKKQSLAGTGLWGYFQTNKAPYQMTDEERAANGSITAADSDRITATLKANKMPVTQKNVMQYYTLEQQKKGKK